jgi:hypothetical protein
MNKELFRETINTIIDFPQNWDQDSWHTTYDQDPIPSNSINPSDSPLNGEWCGSTHCFAGWAQILTAPEETFQPAVHDQDDRASEVAAEALGISDSFANWLFNSDRTFEDLYKTAQGVIAGTIDVNGKDKDGYYVNGFDEEYEDRDGRDINDYYLHHRRYDEAPAETRADIKGYSKL